MLNSDKLFCRVVYDDIACKYKRVSKFRLLRDAIQHTCEYYNLNNRYVVEIKKRNLVTDRACYGAFAVKKNGDHIKNLGYYIEKK